MSLQDQPQHPVSTPKQSLPLQAKSPPPSAIAVSSLQEVFVRPPPAPEPTSDRQRVPVADPVLSFLSEVKCATPVPVFTALPSFQEVLPVIEVAIRQARSIPSGPVSGWNSGAAEAWSNILIKLNATIKEALDRPTPLNIFNACLTFCCAPGYQLAPLFARRPSIGRTNAACATASALRKVQKGQGKHFGSFAPMVLPQPPQSPCRFSKKCTPPSKLSLLPRRQKKLTVDPKQVADRLFKNAANTDLSRDVYGWAASHLFPHRGVQDGVLASVADLCFSCQQPKARS